MLKISMISKVFTSYYIIILVGLLAVELQVTMSGRTVTVSQSGGADFKSINDALASAPRNSSGDYFTIVIEEGVYEEYVSVTADLPYIIFSGVDRNKVTITGNRTESGKRNSMSATLSVLADHFIARNVTIQNTAGPTAGQAVALLVDASFVAFYHCSILGYQDTLYARRGKQFYRECDVYGTVDFIFGDAAAVFQNCSIYVRYWGQEKENTITAQGRQDPSRNTGISVQFSSIKAAEELGSGTTTYLGRPWRNYARTAFVQSFLDELINPAGVLKWDANTSTVFYGEYGNTGPGSDVSHRVNWTGYHSHMSHRKAKAFTVERLIDGANWLNNTNVPFYLGL